MRLSRNRIRARVKTDLPITFSEERISAHAGLELFRRYFGAIERCGFARLTIDVDGSVLRTGVRVEGAARGYNPHHPKDKSYYPLTAHLAQTGQVLRVWNRPGNVHDSHGAVEFLRLLLGELRARFGRRHQLEVRLDGAFCQPDLLHFLDGEDVEYGIKLPLWQWLDLRPAIASRQRWVAVDATVSGFELWLEIPAWKLRKRVVVYRKHVFHRSRKNVSVRRAPLLTAELGGRRTSADGEDNRDGV